MQGKFSRYYLVSNMSVAEEAIQYYKKRFRIETFFSDQKSRGFNIQKSHIEDPQRLSRLLIASCLAYIERVAELRWKSSSPPHLSSSSVSPLYAAFASFVISE